MEKIYTTLRTSLFILSLSFISITLIGADSFANGIISGKITDASTGESLAFANVSLDSTSIGTTTDLEGNYTLFAPEGNYTLVVSYLGYTDVRQEIQIQDGEKITIDVELTFGTLLEAVTISAQASGQISAINEQLASNKIVNVISAEKMEELPDANAAESIGRLPGISVSRSSGEANKVIVRGLSPKYSNVSIEGIKMPSTNDYDRSVDLNLIQGEMLSGVEVSKSLRADMDADAIGGTINLKLRSASEGLKFNTNVEGGYNFLGSSFNNYKVVGAVSNRFFKNKIGARLQLTSETKQLPSHRFGGSYSGAILSQVLDSEGNLTGEESYKFRTLGATLTDQNTQRSRNGATLVLDYDSDFFEVKYFSLYNRKIDESTNRTNSFTFTSPNEPYRQNVGEYRNNTNFTINSLQTKYKFLGTNLNLTLSTSIANSTSPSTSFDFLQLDDGADPINQDYLIFRHPAEVLNSFQNIDVNSTYFQGASLSTSTLKDINRDILLNYEIPFELNKNFSGVITVGGKYHLLTRDSGQDEDFVDYQYGIGRSRKEALIALYPWIETNLGAQRGLEAINFLDPNYDPGVFLDGRYNLGWSADINMLSEMHKDFKDNSEKSFQKGGYSNFYKDYTNREESYAGFAMVEFNLWKKLMILPGLRYEREATSYQSYLLFTQSGSVSGIKGVPRPTSADRMNEFLFPSLNMKYKINDWSFLQAAAYRSTSRPDFRRLSPLVIIPEYSTSAFTSGNPYLKPSTAYNYDLGLAVYGNKIGLFTVNAFYKEVTGFIFTMNNYFPLRNDRIINAPSTFLDGLPGEELYPYDELEPVARTNIAFNNLEKSSYKGIEVSWQTNFWYLSNFLKGFVLDVNATFLTSSTHYPYFDEAVVGVDSSGFFPKDIIGFEYKTREGRFADQPNKIVNVILGYDIKGFSSRLSFRYQERSITGIDTRLALSESYYDDFVLVDLSLKQNITERLSIYANATNILNHIDDYFVEYIDQDPLPTSSEQYGRRIQFGLRYNY
ncbi:TonB-dependent receptor [Portibacter lacus]|uniref:TonB-dependent receptor n=1 Tax=Portibacter lacus TaxID=1099794 RepID=A0AA37WHG1_9BACT|nr:TonB-dependent receptor [Portibacter lacus]GLR18765.1 TonB-dependent receptor [Portibacter lacus]